jgi:hypothetical protein
MNNLFALLVLASLILLLVGVISPKSSLFWYKKDRTRKKSAIFYSITLVVSFILFGITTDPVKDLKVAGVKSDKKEVAEEIKKPELTIAQQDSIKRVEREADSIASAAKVVSDRKEKIESQFSAWDGAHHNLERMIKKNMNDPDSYDHIETTYWDMGDHLVVLTKFRGKNAFGGKVINMVKAKVDLDGNVIKIIDQQ